MILNNGEYQTVKLESAEQLESEDSAMRVVYENGKLLVDDNLDDIRKRAN